MNDVYCVECGARLRAFGTRWLASSNQPCVNGRDAYGHLPDPLDVALRRLNQAKDAVREAKAAVAERQAEYDYLKTVRVPEVKP